MTKLHLTNWATMSLSSYIKYLCLSPTYLFHAQAQLVNIYLFKVMFPKSFKNSNEYCSFLFLGRLGRQGRIVGVPKHNPSVYSTYLMYMTLETPCVANQSPIQ